MLDTNCYDEILRRDGLLNRLNHLTAAEKITILQTHIQEDELSAVPDIEKRERLLDVYRQLAAERIPTDGAAWDVSKWGQATYGGGTGEIQFGDIRRTNPRDARDALIATTASSQADILVTGDSELTKRIRAKNPNLKVWTFASFLEHLRSY
jgi:predicted nucleic acid-binding protein